MRYFLFIFISLNTYIFSNPTDPNIVFGDVTLQSPTQNALHITTSDKAIINWADFSIGSNEITKFIQPSINSCVLNRITTQNVSSILGQLIADGHVFLINPNGVIIGENAIIDTCSFLASTFDITNDEFLKNEDILFKGDSNNAIINYGTISANDGDVTIIAYKIDNFGSLNAHKGQVNLACSHEVLLKPHNDDKILIRPKVIDDEKEEFGLSNYGKITALQIKLKADGNPYQFAIRHDGEIDALGIEEKDGRVLLLAENGINTINGKITAKNEDQTGGKIHILAEQIALFDDSFIDVSAPKGAGEILIGGDYQGKNPDILNSKGVFIGEKVLIDANATINGDGGKVILWGDDNCRFYGTIFSKGGIENGNGGFIEVSSKDFLEFKGKVDALAPFGEIGTLLLDPCEITINTFGGIGTSVPGWINPYIPATVTAQLAVADLTNALLGANVTVNALAGLGAGNGNIIVDTAISWTGPAGGSRLTMIGNTIFINDSITALDITALDSTVIIDLQAQTVLIGAPLLVPGNHTNAILIESRSGSIQVQSSSSLEIYGGSGSGSTAKMISGSGANPGSINITTGDLIIKGGTNLVGNSVASIEAVGSSGTITINATGNATVEGGSGIVSTAAIKNRANGDLNVTTSDLIVKGGTNTISSATIESLGGSGTTTINVTGNLTIEGGTANASDGVINNTTGQDLNITMSGDNKIFECKGGSGPSANGLVQTTNGGKITVNMTGLNATCNFIGGTGAGNTFAGIITLDGGNITCNITGDYTFTAGSANIGLAGVWAGSSGAGSGDVSMTGGNFRLTGGTALGTNNNAYIKTRSGSVDINATGTIALQAGSIQNVTGSFIESDGVVGTNNITINTNNLSLTASPNPVTNSIAEIKTGAGNILVNATGNVTLRGSDVGTNNTARIRTTTSGNVTFIANSLDLMSGLGSGAIADIFTPSGDINVTTSQYCSLVGTAGNLAKIETQGSNILIKAGTDFTLGSFSSIINSGIGDLTLVVDDLFPNSPILGEGKFTMASTAVMSTTNGALRIFSSKQSLNSILGTLNGSSFTPGSLFSDTQMEKWSTYFPDSFNGIPFTIFYKDSETIIDLLPTPVFIASAEIFRDLHPYNEYIDDAIEFETIYSQKPLDELFYFIRRRSSKYHNLLFKKMY